MLAFALAFVLQAAIPAPVGYVNDFAHVLDPSSVAHLEAVIAEVRQKTGGEIVVVTVPDLGGRSASDAAVKLGREWGVGAKGEAGDPAKNLGVVILLMPRHDHRPGTGDVFIASGRGAEGFLTDARSGRIRDAMVPFLAREDYGAALALGVDLIAQAFAEQFGVTLSGTPPSEPAAGEPVGRSGGVPLVRILLILALLLLFRRGRLALLPFMLGGLAGRGGRGWGGGGGGGGGGFGGGFGGFGGGGGFSGGGAGGKF